MTCINGKYKNGKPTCTEGYPVQLMKCLKGGLPCYKEKGEVKKNGSNAKNQGKNRKV